jgi:hypothetical protein
MSIGVLYELPPVSVKNTFGISYINGDATTEGSLRFAIDPDTGITVIEKLIDGVWQPTSFETGPDTMWAGRNVGIAGLGHHLATESSDGHLHFHAHSEYDGELTIQDTQVICADFYMGYLPVQPDESGEFIGKVFEYVHLTTSHALLETFYIKTSSVPAGNTIRFQVWKGTDDTGFLTFDQSYSASMFPINTEVALDLKGKLEYLDNTNYFFRLSSDSNFSIKTNGAGTLWTLAIAFSRIREDNLLQTKQYVDGDTFSEGQYLIQDRNIYVCNITGVQTGTFGDNSDKWSILTDKDYVNSFDNKTLKTGIISGGALSIASATTINIAAGTGIVIDTTDASNIIRSDVSWNEVLGYAPNLSLDGSNIIIVDSNGNISDIRNVDKTDETYRDYIILGTVSIYMSSLIHADSRPYNLGYVSQSFEDFERDIIGPSTISGLVYSANGANLSLDYTEGRIFNIGCGFALGAQNTPNEKDISGVEAPVLFMTYHDGPTLYPDGGPTIYVNPDKIDNGDGTTSSVGNNNWTVQRIFYSPTATLVSYGQEEYNTFDLAIESINSQEFFEAGALPASWFRAFLVIKEGAVDLSDITQAVFFEAPKFRLFGAGGGGIAGGVSAHSSLSKLEWNVAGHLFEDAGIFNIGTYSFLMPDTFEVDTAGNLTLSDTSRDRIVSNESYFAAYAPNGGYHVMVSNGHIALEDEHGSRFVAQSTETMLFSPWDGSSIVLRDSGITFWGDLIVNDNLDVIGVLTAVTQSPLDNSTKAATTAYVDSAVSVEDLWNRIGTVLSSKMAGDDLSIGGDITLSTAWSKINASDGNGHLEFGEDARLVWKDVGNNKERLLINAAGSYLNAPDGSRQIVINNDDVRIQSGTHSYFKISTGSSSYDSGVRFTIADADQWVFYSDNSDGNFYFNENTSDTRMALIAGGGLEVYGDLKVDNSIIFSATYGLVKSYDELGYLAFGSNGGLYWQDVGNNTARFSITSTASYLVAPGAAKYIEVTDNGVEVKSVDSHSSLIIDAPLTGTVYDSMIKFRSNEVDKWTISSDHSNDTLYLFEGTSGLRLFISPTEFSYSDAIERLKMDANDSRLISPNGTKSIFVRDDKIYIGSGIYPSSLELTGDLNVTGYINSESNIVAQGKLQAVSTDDGETLLQFETPRRWVFQQEGTGSGAALRLRNLLGQNKNFFIDTGGGTIWRNYNGSPVYMSHTAGNLWAMGNITAGGQLQAATAKITALPTSDPLDTGALWNDGGTVKVSA